MQHGFKQRLEQRLALLGLGAQHLGKASLGQQDHLAKLGGVEAHDLLHLPGHLGDLAGDGLAIWPHQPLQHRRGCFFGAALAPGLGGRVGRAALHPIAAAAGRKFQLHPGHRQGAGVVRAQAFKTAIARHLAIEGKADGIQQKGLAGAGAAVNQKQSLAAEGIEIDLHPLGVWPKGLDAELVGLHCSPLRRACSSAWRSSSASVAVASRPC